MGVSANTLALDPAPVKMGPVDFIPTLAIDIDNNDNIYLQSEGETSSAIYIIRPDLVFKAQNNLDTYKANLYIESGSYADSLEGDDNFLDAGLLLDGHWEFNDKNRLNALIHTEKLHDARGDVFSAGTNTSGIDRATTIKEVDTYSTTDLGLTYELGIGNTNTGFEIGYTMHGKSYNDNTYLDGGNADNSTRDLDSGKIDLRFFYQLMPKTKIFIALSSKDISYSTDINRNGVKTLDSNETYVYLGTEWDVTANTTGRVKLGTYSKNYDDKAIQGANGDLSQPAWEIALDWRPLELSSFMFNSGSYVAENEGSGTARAIQDFEASWRQDWLENFHTKASFLYEAIEHQGTKVTLGELRKDKDNTLTLAAVYNFRRWMDFSLDYKMKSRSSTIDGSSTGALIPLNFEYDPNILSLSAKMSL